MPTMRTYDPLAGLTRVPADLPTTPVPIATDRGPSLDVALAGTRPVVALDVDGVVNAILTLSGERGDEDQVPMQLDGTTLHRVVVPAADVPDSPFVRGWGRSDLDVVVQVNPEVVTWLQRLVERADVVWATTWEHCANLALAPLLGIDPLPVAVTVAAHPPKFGWAKNGDSAPWKAWHLEDVFEGRPLAWLDDSAWRYKTETAGPLHDDATDEERADYTEFVAYLENERWRKKDPTLVVVPNQYAGLTAEDMAAVDAFVDEHTH